MIPITYFPLFIAGIREFFNIIGVLLSLGSLFAFFPFSVFASIYLGIPPIQLWKVEVMTKTNKHSKDYLVCVET